MDAVCPYGDISSEHPFYPQYSPYMLAPPLMVKSPKELTFEENLIMTPATTTTTGSTLQNATISPPELQPRDREFINALKATETHDLVNHEDRQKFFERMIKIASTGVEATHKQAETAMTVYAAARALSAETIRLVSLDRTTGEPWNRLSNAWEALGAFNSHLDKYAGAIRAGIAKESGIESAINTPRFPSNLKSIIADLS